MASQGYTTVIARGFTDGPTLTAAAAASCIPTPAKITLPNNFWYVGKTMRIKMAGRISSVITTPGTARFDVRIGAVVAWDGLAVLLDTVVGYTTVGWTLEILLQCRAEGAGTVTQLVGQGVWTCTDILGTPATPPKAAVCAILPWNTAPGVLGTGFDNTAANTLDVFFTQTAATGSMTVHEYLVEDLN